MRKQRPRQAALLRLVQSRQLGSQEEMVQLLREEGFQVTQASVSRDVRELGLVRIDGCYVPAANVSAIGTTIIQDSELIVSVEPVGSNLLVVKTPPGTASSVAVELDGKNVQEIAGTVAGDDTILVAVRSRAAQGRVLALFKGAPLATTSPSANPNADHEEPEAEEMKQAEMNQ